MLLLISAAFVAIILYRRYFPVLGVQDTHLKNLDLDKIKVIDIRDYNESYKSSIDGAIKIPIAYLKRNVNDIPNTKLHLIVSSHLEKNIGIRYLRKKGFCVVGYTMVHPQQFINPWSFETNC